MLSCPPQNVLHMMKHDNVEGFEESLRQRRISLEFDLDTSCKGKAHLKKYSLAL